MHLCIIFAAQVFDFNIFVETVINHSKVWGKIKRVYIYIYIFTEVRRGCIELIKSDRKDICNVKKDVSNKCFCFHEK